MVYVLVCDWNYLKVKNTMRSVRAAKEAIAKAKACKMAEEKCVRFEKILKELRDKRKTFNMMKSQRGC